MRQRIYLLLLLCMICMRSLAISYTISPATVVRDTTMVIAFNGIGTHFSDPNTQVVFNDFNGLVSADILSIDSVWAISNTLMYIKLTVSPYAPLSGYRVFIQNALDNLLESGNALLVSGIGLSTDVYPPLRGHSRIVDLNAINGDFTNDSILDIRVYQNHTLVNTITVDSFFIRSSTTIRFRLSVGLDAKNGQYAIVVNSRKNGLMKTGFKRISGYLETPSVNFGYVRLMKGKSWVIDVRAVNALVKTGAPNTGLDYQSDLSGKDSLVNGVIIDSCVASSDTAMKVYLHIDMSAGSGFHTLRFSNKYDSGIPLAILVTPYYPPTILEIYPKELPRGQRLEVNVYGTATNFNQGITTLKFWKNSAVSDQIKVDSVQALDSTLLKAYLTIDSLAYAGLYTVEVFDTFDAVPAFYDVQVPKSPLITDPLFYSVLSGEQGVVDVSSAGALFTKATDAHIWIAMDSTMTGRNEELTVDSFHAVNDHQLRVWFSSPKTSSGYYLLYYHSTLDDTLRTTSYLQVYSPFLRDTTAMLARNDSVTVMLKGNFTDFHRIDSVGFGFYDSWANKIYFIDSGLTCTSYEVLSDSLISVNIKAGKEANYSWSYYIFLRDTAYGFIHSASSNITIRMPEVRRVTPDAIWREPDTQTVDVEIRYLPDLEEHLLNVAFTYPNPDITLNKYSVTGNSIQLEIALKKEVLPTGDYPLTIQLKDGSTLTAKVSIRKAVLVDYYPKQFADTNGVFTFVLKGASKGGLHLQVVNGSPDFPYVFIDSISYAKEDTITMVAKDTLRLFPQIHFFIYNDLDNTIGDGNIRASVIDGVHEIMVQPGEILFENPAYGDIVFINKGNTLIKRISIIDIQGKEVYAKNFSKSNQGNLMIERNAIPGLQGLYFLRFETDKSQFLHSKILIGK